MIPTGFAALLFGGARSGFLPLVLDLANLGSSLSMRSALEESQKAIVGFTRFVFAPVRFFSCGHFNDGQ